MYNLPYFKEKDAQVLVDFMKSHSFAMLIGCHQDVPVATQVPFLFEERDGKLFLQGHIMRNTNHHKALAANPNALCVFTGPHTYVSASLYTNQRSASTWNYMTVHARGQVSFLGEAALWKILEETTSHYEGDPHSPASFDQLPKEYVEKLMKAIVGIEMEVKEMDHVFKLSQNHDQVSYSNIIKKLSSGDPDAKRIAEEMQLREASIFKKD